MGENKCDSESPVIQDFKNISGKIEYVFGLIVGESFSDYRLNRLIAFRFSIKSFCF